MVVPKTQAKSDAAFSPIKLAEAPKGGLGAPTIAKGVPIPARAKPSSKYDAILEQARGLSKATSGPDQEAVRIPRGTMALEKALAGVRLALKRYEMHKTFRAFTFDAETVGITRR